MKENEESSNSDDIEDNEQPCSSERDDNNTANINFGGQRRYGRPQVKYRWHKKSFGRQNRKCYDRDRGSTHNGYQKPFDQKCFNCGSPECKLSAYPEPKNQERIQANLDAWRKSKQIKRPLREIDLATIASSSFVIVETISAEIFFEHCNKATKP